MSLTRQKILQIQITASPREKILEHIEKYLGQAVSRVRRQTKKTVKPLVVLTPNPEQIVAAQGDTAFAEVLNRADVALPDGIGIVWAGKVLYTGKKSTGAPGITDRIAGADFMEELVALAAERGVSIGLIGGYRGLAVEALECLMAKYHGLDGWATDGPELALAGMNVTEQPAEAYWETLAGKIEKNGTTMLFVGMGAPKQELVISKIEAVWIRQGATSPLVLMAVGGTFAMITGRLKRAPLFIRSIGFEWFWRLFQEPWRWKRQLAILQFIILVIREWFRRR